MTRLVVAVLSAVCTMSVALDASADIAPSGTAQTLETAASTAGPTAYAATSGLYAVTWSTSARTWWLALLDTHGQVKRKLALPAAIGTLSTATSDGTGFLFGGLDSSGFAYPAAWLVGPDGSVARTLSYADGIDEGESPHVAFDGTNYRIAQFLKGGVGKSSSTRFTTLPPNGGPKTSFDVSPSTETIRSLTCVNGECLVVLKNYYNAGDSLNPASPQQIRVARWQGPSLDESAMIPGTLELPYSHRGAFRFPRVVFSNTSDCHYLSQSPEWECILDTISVASPTLGPPLQVSWVGATERKMLLGALGAQGEGEPLVEERTSLSYGSVGSAEVFVDNGPRGAGDAHGRGTRTVIAGTLDGAGPIELLSTTSGRMLLVNPVQVGAESALVVAREGPVAWDYAAPFSVVVRLLQVTGASDAGAPDSPADGGGGTMAGPADPAAAGARGSDGTGAQPASSGGCHAGGAGEASSVFGIGLLTFAALLARMRRSCTKASARS